VPLLVDPALPPGALSSLAQPRLGVEGELVLRPWRADDVPAVTTAFACPEIQRWHTLRLDGDREARAWMARWADRWADETAASWAVVAGADDRVVGQVGLRAVVLFEASAHLSYWVLPAARGRGLAARAVRTLSRWAFQTVGLHRLAAVHSTANAASCRVATRCGLEIEGTLRAAGRHADGWHDMHVHAGLRPPADGPGAG
jgi:RimJ/RimL family protein N-acetyltransferase